jgi:hypothetical protein
VASIALRLWSSDNRGWRTAQEQSETEAVSATSGSSKGQIIAQATGTPVVTPSWTGLELTLRLANSGNPLQKVFLLGAV